MTKERLSQLYHLNRELLLWEAELTRLENESIVRSPNMEAISKPGVSDKTGELATKIADCKAMIEAILDDIQVERMEMIKFIESVPDSLIRQILYHRFVEGLTWQGVADKVGNNTESSVRMAFNRFITSQ